jgi:tripartite-type tricarboxylate transporter receptor subunit TctC
LAAGLALFAAAAQAQDYPNRHITIIAPFAAGGPSDTVGRIIAGPLGKALGQEVIVENITGAGGTIGSTRAARAAPDGYTLVVAAAGTHAAVQALYANLSYHPIDSYEAIGLINTTPVVVVGRKDFPPNTLSELVAYLRANEKKVTEANAGIGSVSQFGCAYFKSLIGIKPTEVSYRGTSQATTDLLAGNVDYLCNQIVNVVDYVKTGAIKAYAVTGDTRSPMLPDVPTTAEAGMPEFHMVVWYGLLAPKGTPKPIIDKLNAALSAAMDDPGAIEAFAKLGFDIAPPEHRSPGWFENFIRSEIKLWTSILGPPPAAGSSK